MRMSVFGESVTVSSESEAGEERAEEAASRSESSSHEALVAHRSARAAALRCAEHVYTKLCIGDTNPLPVKSHRAAVQNMLQLRNLMRQSPDEVDRDVRMLLLYAGVSV